MWKGGGGRPQAVQWRGLKGGVELVNKRWGMEHKSKSLDDDNSPTLK